MSSTFTVTPNTLSGYSNYTTFTYQTNIPYDYVYWDLGDGTNSNEKQTVYHIYKYPGTYDVCLSAYRVVRNYSNLNSVNELISLVDKKQIYVDSLCRDKIIFSKTPSEYGMAGDKTTSPFVISLTSSQIDKPLAVTLFSRNSKSIPHFTAPKKWKFITPTWRFVDAETDEILDESVIINTTPIIQDSKTIGVSGELSFYYIDDTSTGTDATNKDDSVLLIATLSTVPFTNPDDSVYYNIPSYANTSLAVAAIPWFIAPTPINGYRLSENFINDVYPIKWENVPIPLMINCTYFADHLDVPIPVLEYPKTNEIGLENPITLRLQEDGVDVPDSLYELETTPLYFKSTDENGHRCSGYIFTSLTPLTSFRGNMRVKGIPTILGLTPQDIPVGEFGFPYGYKIFAQAFVNNIFKNNINILKFANYTFSPTEAQELEKAFTDVPDLVFTDVRYNEIAGTAATYGISFNPKIDRLYALDADQDTLLYFNKSPYNLTKSISLSDQLNDFPTTPSYVSIDGEDNLWVSFWNNPNLLKFDKDLNYLLTVAPTSDFSPLENTIDGSLWSASPIVETDQDNNIWACYAHPSKSTLLKFDKNGNRLFKASQLSESSVPVSLSIDPYKNVWVACYNSNVLELYSSTTGQLLSSVTGNFTHPSYTAVDRKGNLWFTHGYNFCSKLDTKTSLISTWKFEPGLTSVTNHDYAYNSQEQYEANQENEIWSGLSIDVYDRVWIVDGKTNNVGVFSSSNPKTLKKTEILPQVTQDEYDKSAQVSGDWTGNRWYQKYAGEFNVDPYFYSTDFKILNITDYKIAKVNETFDYGKYVKSLALPEILNSNTELFDKFLPALVGDEVPWKESLGRVCYERIANFVQTHSDVETSEIPQLISLAQQMAVNPKIFSTDFPSAVARLIDLFSVPKARLRGIVNYDTDQQPNYESLLDENTIIKSGQRLLVKDRYTNTFQLVVVSPIDNLTQYPLSQLRALQLKQPLFENYYFFAYGETPFGYKQNIIDWDSEYTTISYNLSTSEEWYGDEGLLDIVFNNLLTEQLFLNK